MAQTLSLIAAVARNGVIGREGALPWRLSADLKRFKELTTGHTIIMGRKTCESIGRPLPNRRNIVLSGSTSFGAEGCIIVLNIAQAIGAAGDGEVFVIGGHAVYEAFLPLADRVHLTRVEAEVSGDVRFPELHPEDWRETKVGEHPVDEKNEYPMTFLILERAAREA
jgi:dihydrofolate reductase